MSVSPIFIPHFAIIFLIVSVFQRFMRSSELRLFWNSPPNSPIFRMTHLSSLFSSGSRSIASSSSDFPMYDCVRFLRSTFSTFLDIPRCSACATSSPDTSPLPSTFIAHSTSSPALSLKFVISIFLIVRRVLNPGHTDASTS